jgi:uncharacterized phage infection (PIP) family protein YhgE
MKLIIAVVVAVVVALYAWIYVSGDSEPGY